MLNEDPTGSHLAGLTDWRNPSESVTLMSMVVGSPKLVTMNSASAVEPGGISMSEEDAVTSTDVVAGLIRVVW